MGSPSQRLFCLIGLFTVLMSGRLQAQTLGTFTGEVKDSTGAAVSGATVTVRNTATNGSRIVTTNDDGAYTIPALVPGMYDVKAENPELSTITTVQSGTSIVTESWDAAGMGAGFPQFALKYFF